MVSVLSDSYRQMYLYVESSHVIGVIAYPALQIINLLLLFVFGRKLPSLQMCLAHQTPK